MVDSSASQALTVLEQRNLEAVFGVHPYWDQHDVDGVLAFYDDEVTWVNVAFEETYVGKDAVGAFLTRLFTALPDLTFSADFALARGDQVAERWSVRGTHRATFMGVPATGRPIEITGVSLLTMRDGRFLRDEFYSDGAAVMRQVGLLPPLRVLQGRVGRSVAWLAVKSRPSAWRAARR